MFPPGTLRHRFSVTLSLLLVLTSLWWPVRDSQNALRGMQRSPVLQQSQVVQPNRQIHEVDSTPLPQVAGHPQQSFDAVVYHDPHLSTRARQAGEIAETLSRSIRLTVVDSSEFHLQMTVRFPGVAASNPGDRSLVVQALSPIALHVLLRV